MTKDNIMKKYLCVIRVDFNDGTATFPVYISGSQSDFNDQVDMAVEHFSNLYNGKGIVSTHYAQDLYFAGVNDIEGILAWKDYKNKLDPETSSG